MIHTSWQSSYGVSDRALPSYYIYAFTPLFYPLYIDDIFVVFKSPDHLKITQIYLNYCHINISFTIETENSKIFLFLDVVCEQGKFTTDVYWKPTF